MNRFSANVFRLLFSVALSLAVARAATKTWTGASNATWSTAGNWSGGVPGSADTVQFSTNTANDPNLTANTTVGAITFLSGTDAEAIAGSSTLTLAGLSGVGITNTSGQAHTFAPAIALGGNQTWSTSGTGSNLSFDRTISLGSYTLTASTGTGTTIAVSTGNGDVISGTGALVKTGDGTLTIGNVANTFTGGVTLNAGITTIGNNASLGTGNLTFGGGTLNAAADRTLSNNVTIGSGGGTFSGAAGVDFTLSSNTVVGSGNLSVVNTTGSGTATTLGFSGSGFTLASNISLGASTELRPANSSGTQTYSGVISGAGVVHQNTAGGTAILTGNNTFTGGTVLDAGTLSLGHDNAAGTGTLDLSGGTLTSSSSRILANDIAVSGASTIAAANGVNFTFATDNFSTTSGGLTLDNTSDAGLTTLGFTGSGFTFSRTIAFADAYGRIRLANTSGTQTFSAVISGSGSLLRDVAGGTTALNANNTFTGGVTLSAGALSLGQNSALGTGTFTFAGGEVSAASTRSIANATALTGNGTVGGAANFTFTGGITQSGGNQTLSITNTGVTTISTTALTLSELNAARTLTLDVDGASGGLVVSGVIQDGSGTGADSLVKNGGGALTLSGANTFTGGATLNAGNVTIGNNAAFGTGTLTLGGANLTIASDYTLTNALSLAGNTTVTGQSFTDLVFSSNSISASSGTLSLANTSGSGATTVGFSGSGFTFSGGVALGDFTELRLLNTSGTQTYSGVISGTGLVRMNGAGGTAVLNGSNTFSGGITLDAGTVNAGNDNALGTGTLTLHGGTLTADASRTFANDFALTGSSTIAGGNGVDFTFTSDTIGGNSGTLTLDNTADTGRMSVGFSGSGFTLARAINLSDAATELRFSNTSGTQTFSAAISGTGTVRRDAAGGTTVLSATNTYSGGTTVAGGTLALGSNAALGSGTVNLAGGTLQGDGTTTRTIANALTLTGNSTLGGAAILNLTGGLAQSAGSYSLNITNTAATTLSGNAVTIAADGSPRTLTLNVDGASGGLTVSSIVQNGSGVGTLAKDGAGTATLTNSGNSFTGGVIVNNGILAGTGNTATGGFTAFGNYSGLGSPTNVITVNNGGSLAVSSTNTSGSGTGTTTALQTMVLNGAGYNGGGALVANGGTNTWTGSISLGSDATVTNNGAPGDPNLLFLGPYTLNPPVNFALNNHTVTFNGTGDVYLTESMGAASGPDTGSVIINGGTDSTTVYYAGIKSTYTGDTNVNRGILELLVPPGNNPNSAILGNLTIGTNSATTTARVIDFYSDQIKDTATVTINSDGTLDLATFSKSEDIGKLILNGGTVSTGTGLLYLANVASGPNISVTGTNLTSTISGVMWLQGSTGSLTTRTIDVAATDTLNLTANVFGGNLIKTGNGTMMMNFNNAANGYTGNTTVAGGILNIQHSGALGGNATVAAGTIVNSGATLQLQATSGSLAVGTEALTLNGTGYNNLGALNSVTGANNTWAGGVTLGSSATVNTNAGSALTINGTLTGTATTGNTQYLTAGGAGNTTYAGPMSDGSGGGSLGLIKADSGTVTISGTNSFSGTIAVNAGTLVAGANATLGNQANAVSIASGATLSMASGADASHVFVNSMSALTGSGTITVGTYAKAILNVASTDTFDGLISGTGTFNLNGDSSKTGTLTLTNGATNFAGTLAIDRGELDFSSSASGSTFANVTIGNSSTVTTLKLNNANITFGTLTINGDTILDFGNSGASILNTTNIYIAAGATLTVKNWDSEVDFLYASTHFSQIGGTDATKNQIGTMPENQVKFANTFDANGAYTTWTDNNVYSDQYGPYQNRQIRPVPEPATYGALFMAAALGFLGYRHFRRKVG
ncbi:MAG: autotransporter-associated beta strand repeat-containing protein [Verrucomicrobia bacterium]|nr:autotransporter-associated beta strand repeat-containing protein [Verrucomicrobiota bacterium]